MELHSEENGHSEERGNSPARGCMERAALGKAREQILGNYRSIAREKMHGKKNWHSEE